MLPVPRLPPRWLSFDCYGTLIDWESGVRRAFREIARVASEDEEEIYHSWESLHCKKIQSGYVPYGEVLQQSFRETLNHFGYRCTSTATDGFVESLARWKPFDDVNPALIRLS